MSHTSPGDAKILLAWINAAYKRSSSRALGRQMMRKVQDLSLDDQGDVSIITERDIWVSAGIFIQTYGDAAGFEAARRADDYLSDGDIAGHAMWKRIVVAIKRMTDVTDEVAN